MSQNSLQSMVSPFVGHRATCKMMSRCWSPSKVLNLGCTSESFGERKNTETFRSQPESVGLGWGWGATKASRYFFKKIISAVVENHWSGLVSTTTLYFVYLISSVHEAKLINENILPSTLSFQKYLLGSTT